MFSIDQFNFELPPERIANAPADPRDTSRLLVVDRETGLLSHLHFYDLPSLLGPNDVIVRNNTRVIPARIYGQKETGGKCEILLVHQTEMSEATTTWECMTKPGLKPGQTISFANSDLTATCTEITGFTRKIEFNKNGPDFFVTLNQVGHTPIPPYIEWSAGDEEHLRQVYQTTFAKIQGSVAAPTAGLHFTQDLDEKLRQKGVTIEEVTLHVGLGTFLPLQDEQLASGTLHHEYYEVLPEVAERLTTAKRAGKRIISVGTTTTRTLETCTQAKLLNPGKGDTNLFIQPGYQFQFVDVMITNFHLPKSSLLMLISAFGANPNTTHPFKVFSESIIGKAYQAAIDQEYRFYSFGDAMMLT
jgi:S-adenosylmethionine:tRNA ribosyltransferase-isomerase